MSRRPEKEKSLASAEAFRGGIVGTAKVEDPLALHPQLPAAHTPHERLLVLGLTDTVAFLVGSPCRWPRFHRLLPIPYLSRIDYTIQSVCSCAV